MAAWTDAPFALDKAGIAVIGAVVGISLARGGRGLDFRTLFRVGSGWVTTPVFATLLAFILLFIVQNVFELPVHQ